MTLIKYSNEIGRNEISVIQCSIAIISSLGQERLLPSYYNHLIVIYRKDKIAMKTLNDVDKNSNEKIEGTKISFLPIFSFLFYQRHSIFHYNLLTFSVDRDHSRLHVPVTQPVPSRSCRSRTCHSSISFLHMDR